MMSTAIVHLKKILFEGIRLAGHGSYERRSPSARAMPLLVQARTGLIRFMEENVPTEESWRLLAHAEECLLHYGAARRCLERAMELSGKREKKDLKKIALYKEYEKKWRNLVLTPSQLKALGEFLDARLQEAPFERNLKWTQIWLEKTHFKNSAVILEALRENGGYNDFQVLANVIHG